MKFIGAHVSVSGGVEKGPLNGAAIGAEAIAIFTKNQRQWKAKPLTEKSISLFKENLANAGIKSEKVLVHDSYLINLGNNDPDKRRKSLDSFIDEIKRCEKLGLHLLNFHPGSHLKMISEEECLDLIVESIDEAMAETEHLTLVIENTAGQGTNVGYKFQHLAHIINGVKNRDRIGVCIDTCHTFASGYDMRDMVSFTKTMDEFEKIVGFKYLKGMHINDSKKDLASRVDRHDSLGVGFLGIDPFKFIMEDPRFDDIPLILETPRPEIWGDEIKLLRGFAGQ
jgi:deoxyribonuclease IV